jgi:hypothetical protein
MQVTLPLLKGQSQEIVLANKKVDIFGRFIKSNLQDSIFADCFLIFDLLIVVPFQQSFL